MGTGGAASPAHDGVFQPITETTEAGNKLLVNMVMVGKTQTLNNGVHQVPLYSWEEENIVSRLIDIGKNVGNIANVKMFQKYDILSVILQ